jgi:hypothetical protein
VPCGPNVQVTRGDMVPGKPGGLFRPLLHEHLEDVLRHKGAWSGVGWGGVGWGGVAGRRECYEWGTKVSGRCVGSQQQEDCCEWGTKVPGRCGVAATGGVL